MKFKRSLTLALSAALALSLCACGGGQPGGSQSTPAGSTPQSPDPGLKVTMGQDVDVEVNQDNATEHLNSYEASTTGKWEAMFVPIEMEGRAIDMANFDLTPTAEELEAMKSEPAYGQKVLYYMSDGCTSGPVVADHLGYYTEAGLEAEEIGRAHV